MKSYFFGLNAKVALALLAICGTVLTGCYEKEDGDVEIPIPVVQPDPVYYINGLVTDIATETALEGVKVTISTATENATTNPNGLYEIKSNDADGNAVITFTKTGYKTVTVDRTIAKIGKGKTAVYNVSAAMEPDNYVPSLSATVVTVEYGTETKKFIPADTPAMDVINNTNSTIDVDFEITHPYGAKLETALTTNDFDAKITEYLKAIYGQDAITTDYPTTETPYKVYIGSMWALNAITSVTSIKESTYTFTLGAETKTVKVYNAYKCEISNEQVAKGHGTGHGHGHGGDLNAGGGIFNPVQ